MYWVMQDDLGVGAALIGSYPELPLDVSWVGGRRIRHAMPTPLRFRILEDSGRWMSAFFGAGIPLMRRDLIEALESSGVANLERFAARIEDPRDGAVFDDYEAVNVVGVVSAADMEQSVYERAGASRLIDVDFDSLVVSPTRARGVLLFRLAECVSALIAHDRVRRAVEPLGFPGVAFLPPDAWIG